MKKSSVSLILAAAFSAGAAFAQPVVPPTVAEKSSTEAKRATPEKSTRPAKKPMTKEEKKAAFAERHAEMQKHSGAKFSTASPHQRKAKTAKMDKKVSSDGGQAK